MDIIKQIEAESLREVAEFNVGDTVRVNFKVIEGNVCLRGDVHVPQLFRQRVRRRRLQGCAIWRHSRHRECAAYCFVCLKSA